MKRLALAALALAACGDDPSPLDYKDPPAGGLLRLVKNAKASKPTSISLDLIVGDQPLTGYATGFNLPLAPGLVRVTGLSPGALDPGSAPAAMQSVVPESGPLAGVLVVAVSQKAAGEGAIPTDTALAPKAVLLTVRLDLVTGAASGVVFDGTAADFALPSGGLRDRAGLTVVEPKDVAIGKLDVHAPD